MSPTVWWWKRFCGKAAGALVVVGSLGLAVWSSRSETGCCLDRLSAAYPGWVDVPLGP